MLWTIAYQLACLVELIDDIIANDTHLTIRRSYIPRQTLKCGRFTGSINSQERETLSEIEPKGDVLNSNKRLTEQRSVRLAELKDAD